MQSVSSRIWTRIVVSNSYDDNHYTTGTSLLLYTLLEPNLISSVVCDHKFLDDFKHLFSKTIWNLSL